ncbi:MAG: hypothetical protein ACX94B_01705 [Henriciella sp.]
MRYRSLASLAFLASLFVAPAEAQCDISQTICALDGKKCNIKFRNITDESSGSGAGTDYKQGASAQTIKVKARKANGNNAGNALTIDAGASNTMNVDNKAKKAFADIRISAYTVSSVSGVTMKCEDVVDTLNGNGTCKIFNGQEQGTKGQLVFTCNGGAVTGP